MATDFLHGVEVVEVDSGPRPVRTVRSAVIGVVGTAERGPVNTPTLIAGDRALAAATFGEAGTLTAALNAIFDQIGAVAVAVNCLDPAARSREVSREIALADGGLTIPDASAVADSLEVANAAGDTAYRLSLTGRLGDYRYDASTRRLTRENRPQLDVPAAAYQGAAGVWTLPTQRVASVVATNAGGTIAYRETLPDRLGDYALDAAAGTLTRTDRGAAAAVAARNYQAPAGATGVINLRHQRVSAVTVKKGGAGGTVLTAGTDYTLDAAAGTITRIASSTSYAVNAADVNIAYTRAAGPAADAELSIAYRRLAGMGAADSLALTYDVPDASAATADDVAGEVGADGSYSGSHALLAAESELGYRPRILCAPEFSDQLVVGQALIARAERLRAVAVIDGPATTDAEAVAYAGQLTASRRAYLVDPGVLVSDGDGGTERQAASARVAGVIARSDSERGFWWSPSNRQILGILGASRPIDWSLGDANARANLLNEANVATIVNGGAGGPGGHRLWGNRTLSDDAKFAFLSVARTADLIQDSIQRAHVWAVDRNITRTYLEAVSESVTAYIAELVGLGALAGGECVPSDLNTATTLAAGRVYFDVEFTPYSPAERVTFRVALVNDYLEEVLS